MRYNVSMDTFKFLVELEVTVDAYSEADASEMIEDEFGVGEACGVTVNSINIVKE